MGEKQNVYFNFLVSRSIAEIGDLVRLLAEPGLAAQHSDIFSDGELAWCLQTYVNLSTRGKVVAVCTNAIDRNAINIVYSGTLVEIAPDPHAFVACVRADYPKRQWAHCHLVQNRHQSGRKAVYIPLWVQADLKCRNIDRSGVKVVGYSGQISRNLAGTVDEWRRLLHPYAIDFLAQPRERWHDLSEIDVLIGIRSFDRNRYDTKPPSKLFNAWHARIPFIGGNDSAYVQVGAPGEDYLVAISARQAVARILRLRDDPEHFARLVTNGAKKAQQYTLETIAQAWEATLLGSVAERYAAWKASRGKTVRYFAGLAVGLGMHHFRSAGRTGLKTIRNAALPLQRKARTLRY